MKNKLQSQSHVDACFNCIASQILNGHGDKLMRATVKVEAPMNTELDYLFSADD